MTWCDTPSITVRATGTATSAGNAIANDDMITFLSNTD
jgi:hypothetical protein